MDNQKIRKENIVWTVSEDYNYLPTIKLFDEYRDFDMDYYKMMVLGYVYKVVDIDSFMDFIAVHIDKTCLLYTSPSPRDRQKSRMPSSA